MKKMTFLACAVMLTSAVVVTSCKDKENEPTKQNEVVKTEFSIELPSQVASGPNRMPGTTVQKQGRTDFQGMTSIFLVPFVKQAAIVSGDTRLGNNIHLSDIADASALGTVSNAKVYTNVSIPLTTASFLFYAESAASGDKFNKGSLTAVDTANNKQPADYHFDLEPIVANLASAHADADGKAVALLAYINSVANATDGTYAWREYDPAVPGTYDPAMAAMFAEYKKLHTLSSNGVQRMMQDLYNSLVPLTTTLATNLKAAIAASATITGSAEPYTVTLNSTLLGYPANILLPEEAVHIKWDAAATPNPAFRFCTEGEYTAANHALPHMFTYPSSLWYYANSRINTSNSSKQAMYNNTNDWATILGAHEAARAVNTNTRAVAITDPIQYAVARLDVQVKLAAGVLEDNTPVTAQNVTCASYPVTGVFVGGQKNVGFDFTPVGANVYTIYDNVMTTASMAATTSYSAANSTLVLETAGGTTSDKDIRICVEFTNASGVDFIGIDGCLIPAGSKFYVVANLSAAAATETGNKVFKQDYTTTALLNLQSLKNAYNTIPDLRTPKLELGFSVDLSWTAGHTYEINLP